MSDFNAKIEENIRILKTSSKFGSFIENYNLPTYQVFTIFSVDSGHHLFGGCIVYYKWFRLVEKFKIEK